MPRFVILRHETPAGYVRPLHWDLMLETGETLRTWAMTSEPTWDCDIPCEPLADHRRAYLDLEGPLSGERGSVSRWDAGTYQGLENTESKIEAMLHGQRGAYQLTLSRVSVGGERWVARFWQRPPMND